MAGLLDGFSDFIKTPEGQGLLAATFGGLAGARSGAPINSLGRAGLAGMQGYSGAIDRQQQMAEAEQAKRARDMQMQTQQMQLEAFKRKAEEEQGQREWRKGLPAVMEQKVYGAGDEGPTMAPDSNALKNYLMQPNSPFADELLKGQLFPKAADYKEVNGTLLQIGAGGGVKPVYTAPAKPEADPTKVREYEYYKANGGKKSFEEFITLGPTIMAGAVAPLRAAQVASINDKNAYELPPPLAPKPAGGSPVSVTAGGKTYTFPNQAAANSFKMKAGIK